MSVLPTSVDQQTNTTAALPEAELNGIFVEITDVRGKIDHIAQEISAASALISQQPGPDFAAVDALLQEIRGTWLPDVLLRYAKLEGEFANLQNCVKLAADRQIAAVNNLAEVRSLHEQLNKLFLDLQAKAEGSVNASGAALHQAAVAQSVFDQYFGRLGNLKTLYASILNLVLPAPTPIPTEKNVSRFNNDYWCEVLESYRGEDYVKLAFHVHGNMSLGQLQSPLDSKLYALGQVFSVAEHGFEIEDYNGSIKGGLVFKLGSPISATDSILFSYGSSGYSQTEIA